MKQVTARRVRRVVVSLFVGAVLPVVPAHVAHADPLLVPPMGVDVYGAGTSTFMICGHGTSSDSSVSWVLTVEGARVGGDPIAPLPRTSNSPTISAPGFCISVPKVTAAGAGTATLTFAGVGTQVTATFIGYFAWALNLPDQAGGSGIT